MGWPRLTSDGASAPWLLLGLPILFVVAMVFLRGAAGPFWLWSNLDPDYFYLLDALNLINLRPPGHIYHPGTTVQALGAIVIKAMHPFSNADAVTGAVLADPEVYLAAISNVLIGLNAGAMLLVGVAGLAATGHLPVALFLQLGPFLSSLTLKHEFHVKPEALLVFAVLMLMAVATLTLKPGLLERRRLRLAAAFGVVAGFGAATKVTAAPVFLMPVFLLATPAALALYALASLVAFTIFTLPMAGHYPIFLAWLSKVFLTSGVHGRGAETIVNLAVYPGEVVRMLKRPPMHIVLAVSLLALVMAGWRAYRRRPLPALEIRALAGVCVAQIAQAVVVAKQPGGQYMIPAYVLSALALAVLANLVLAWRPEQARFRIWSARGLAVVVGGFVLAQGFTAIRLGSELAEMRRLSLALDNRRFESCARVYYYAASSLTFALYLSDFVTSVAFDGRRLDRGYGDRLKTQTPSNDYWLEDWWRPGAFTLRDWQGPQDIKMISDRYPCLAVRGENGRARAVESYLAKMLPHVSFDRNCSTRNEPIFTTGIHCVDQGPPRP
jgi:hypothetical protein